MSDPMTEVRNHLNQAYQLLDKIVCAPNPLLPVVHNNRKKLSKRDVVRIREMKRNGCTQADIAECMDVHPATISRTIRGIYHR